MSDDVWSSGHDSGAADGGTDLGQPDYDAGVGINQAFSVDNVFKIGIGVLSEQPALVILAAFNLLALQIVAQFLGPMIQIPTMVVLEGSGLDPMLAEAGAQFAGIGAQLVLMPFQTLVTAGAIVAGAQFIRNDQVSYATLYNQGGAMVRLLLFTLIAMLILTVAMVVLVSPVAVGCWVLADSGNTSLAILVGAVGVVVVLLGSLYLSLGLTLGSYAVCIDGLGPIEGVVVSWRAAQGGRITLFVTLLCLGLAGLVGCCFCYIPAFVVQTAGMAGFAGAWLQYARPEAEVASYPFIGRL